MSDADRPELIAYIAEMEAENERLEHEIEVLTRLRPYAAHEWPTVLELERGRMKAEAALAERDAQIVQFKQGLTKLYRLPLLDESPYHERGEDIPPEVWAACEMIRELLRTRAEGEVMKAR